MKKIILFTLLTLVVLAATIVPQSNNNCNLNGFTTFTQGGWGSPSNSTPGGIRDQYFSQVFPAGLIIGSGSKTITLTSAQAVENFLPQGSIPSALTQSYVDPTDKNITVFAGQAAALTMNIFYDLNGAIGSNSTNLSDLVIVPGTFSGKTVSELLTLVNNALGGVNTNFSLSELNDAATLINENFDNGTVDKGYLTCPNEVQKASLGDKVWNDANHDGIQDAGEVGVPNVTIKLYSCDNVLQSTTTTDASGVYNFANLLPGDYYVEFVLPSGYTFSPADQGGNDATDSDANITTGKSICTTLTAGETDNTWDAGIYQIPQTDTDLKVEKFASNSNPNCGDNVTFSIKVINLGPGSSTGIIVGDLLPAGLNYVSATATQGTYNQATGEWNVGSLTANENATLSISTLVDCTVFNSTSINFGAATGYNLFVLQDLLQPSADTEGKIAVGNNADLTHYSVGDLLPSGSGDVLIVGNNLTYNSGTVHGGNVVYGNTTNLPLDAVTITNGTLRKDANVIDFAAATTYLQNLSATLSTYTVNGTTTLQWGTLTLTGTDAYLNVFNVSGSDIGNAHTIDITAPNGSVVIVNISGTSVTWKGGLIINGVSKSKILYNLYQATNLSVSGINILGSVLAPLAHLDYPAGLITGQVIVKSMSGSGQFNLNLFNGDIPGDRKITNTATLLNSTPTDQNSSNNSSNVLITIGQTSNGDNSDTGSNLVVPTPSWPVENATEYNNPPTFNWYLGSSTAGVTYEIQCVAASAEWPADNVYATSSTTSFTMPYALVNGVQYAWRVRSTNGSAKSAWSSTALFTMVANTSGSPVVPTTSWPIGNATEYNNMPTLNWYLASYSPGLSYEIQCVTASEEWPADNVYATSSSLSFTMPNALVNGIQYAWRVRSTNGVAKSAWSSTALFTMVANTSGLPVIPTASWPIGNATEYNNQPTLNWYLGSSTVGLTYEIQCVAASEEWPADNVYATSSSLSFTMPYTLVPGIQYAWRVRSMNGVTKSAWSTTALFTMAANVDNGPVVPTASWPIGNATEYNGMPTLNWYLATSSTGLTYEIQCVAASEEWPADNVFATSSTLSFTMPYALVNGVQYAWRVRSTNGIAKSAWSSTALFTMTANNSVVQPITGCPANNVTVNTDAPQLFWYLPTATTAISSYEIQVADNSNFQDARSFNSANANVQVDGLESGKDYFWKVRSKDANGNLSYYSGTGKFKVNNSATGVEENKEIPTEFSLSQNYPNPFNPTTTIQFTVAKSEAIKLIIYNTLGEEVKTLINANYAPGKYSVNFDANELSSGMYIYRISSPSTMITKKMMLLR
ncbi:MAG: choice-of-anchor A family protein [Ignavibacteriaceae bacterium]|nr:choice-of-anchor A family protein [Ignavibacteriaceae bacterium]